MYIRECCLILTHGLSRPPDAIREASLIYLAHPRLYGRLLRFICLAHPALGRLLRYISFTRCYTGGCFEIDLSPDAIREAASFCLSRSPCSRKAAPIYLAHLMLYGRLLRNIYLTRCCTRGCFVLFVSLTLLSGGCSDISRSPDAIRETASIYLAHPMLYGGLLRFVCLAYPMLHGRLLRYISLT
jgi:hypothetical protein